MQIDTITIDTDHIRRLVQRHCWRDIRNIRDCRQERLAELERLHAPRILIDRELALVVEAGVAMDLANLFADGSA